MLLRTPPVVSSARVQSSHFRPSPVRVRDGLLESTDGDTVYLQARVRRGEDGVALKEGTLTVRRPRPGTRFLLFEFPSLLADLKIVGRFTATPVTPE